MTRDMRGSVPAPGRRCVFWCLASRQEQHLPWLDLGWSVEQTRKSAGVIAAVKVRFWGKVFVDTRISPAWDRQRPGNGHRVARSP
jgi:hypothetical protein